IRMKAFLLGIIVTQALGSCNPYQALSVKKQFGNIVARQACVQRSRMIAVVSIFYINYINAIASAYPEVAVTIFSKRRNILVIQGKNLAASRITFESPHLPVP